MYYHENDGWEIRQDALQSAPQLNVKDVNNGQYDLNIYDGIKFLNAYFANETFDIGIIKATFISLAALTVPHMLLIDSYKGLEKFNSAK